jgi:hypothetical protein
VTPVISDIVAAGAGARRQLADLAVRASRTAPGPALVRLIATVATVVAFGTALPADVLHAGRAGVIVRLLVVIVPVAVGVGLFPRTRWVGFVSLGTVLLWLLATIGFDDPVDPLRVGLLAASLYLLHSAAAMAAVLPYDCVVAPRILLRWAGRVLTVLAVALPLGIGGTAAFALLPSEGSVVGPIVGSVVAAGLAGLLAWLLRRRW